MPTTFEEAFAAIKKLVADFRANEANFLSPAYQEQEARNDFINKFFFALGWDLYHDLQKNPFQQEVKLERGVAMGASERRADYAFYVAPHFRRDNVRFFVEAKKPAGEIATPDNCFQTIRYGANAGTPLAVLTSFRQLAVLDSRYKPDIETATKRVVRSYDYTEYAEEAKFREIFHLFSREAVAGGALEAFAESLPTKRGKAVPGGTGALVIGDAFLQELDAWRGTLARAFKNRNPGLDGEALTEITQRTLDRLVFLRFLEDKLIETRDSVASLGRRGSAWQDFVAASRRLNGIYNGIVFRHHDRLDGPDLQVDDGVFADVCQWLSDPHSSYDFDKIPIHILGSIYERFLGKVIVTTDKRARVEEKPEVRKAGGVYYTPEYIVRYIVENTVGKLIKGKTPARIAEMRFADIACGSGSFLLGVFDLLLHYHRDWFNANPDKAKKAGCVLRDDGAWHLSLKQRREILLNNIYGVDIDHQAVEVAQLSLYLKLLEEETTASAHDYQLEFRETLLPPLSKNIVCGNSLIGTDIPTGLPFGTGEERKLNPMDFEQRFPEIMKRDGFDAILGNPPYVIVTSDCFPQSAIDYLGGYAVAQYKTDLFHLFIQRSIDKLRDGGLLGYIVPNPWLTLKFTDHLRKYILDRSRIQELDIFKHRVFQEADVHTALVFLEKGKPKLGHKVKLKEPPEVSEASAIAQAPASLVEQSTWAQSEGFRFDTRLVGTTGQLAARIIAQFPPLDSVARASLGCQAYNRTKHTADQIAKRVFHAARKLSKEYLPELAGNDVARYQIQRERGEWIKYGPWLHDYRTMDWLQGPRILIREIPGRPPYRIQACYLEETYCNYKTILNVNPSPATRFSMKYLCGLLNSRLVSFLYPLVSNKLVAQSFPRLSVADVRRLPIAPADKARHDRIVALVEQMLAAKKQLPAAQSDADRDFYGNKCAGLDRQIDALVYELYGLTGEEIKIVEAAAA